MSLMETMLVVLIMAMLSAMIVGSIRRFTSAQAFSEGQARIHELADRVVREVSDDVTYASHLFTEESGAAAYLARLALAPMVPAAGSAPPSMTEVGYFQPDDPGVRTTGNYLLLGRTTAPVVLDVRGDATDVVRIGGNRMILYALVGSPSGDLDLARWESVTLLRLNDFERIDDPVRRTEVAMAAYDAGYRFAWEPGREIAGGLVCIGAGGSLDPPKESQRIDADTELVRRGMLAAHRVAVAANGGLDHIAVPAFAKARDGFPGGFEVKIDGTPTGCLVLARVVLVSEVEGSHRNSVELTRVTSSRSGY